MPGRLAPKEGECHVPQDAKAMAVITENGWVRVQSVVKLLHSVDNAPAIRKLCHGIGGQPLVTRTWPVRSRPSFSKTPEPEAAMDTLQISLPWLQRPGISGRSSPDPEDCCRCNSAGGAGGNRPALSVSPGACSGWRNRRCLLVPFSGPVRIRLGRDVWNQHCLQLQDAILQ